MKKIIVLFLVLCSFLISNAAVTIDLDQGIGEFGLIGKCGSIVYPKIEKENIILTYGLSAFYDIAHLNGKLGFLAGYEGYRIDNNYVHGAKFGLRAYRFLNAGVIYSFEPNNINYNINHVKPFLGLQIPFTYLALGVEGVWHGSNIFSIEGTISFSIPIKSK